MRRLLERCAWVGRCDDASVSGYAWRCNAFATHVLRRPWPPGPCLQRVLATPGQRPLRKLLRMNAGDTPACTQASPTVAVALVMEPANAGRGWHALVVEPTGRTWCFASMAELVRYLAARSGAAVGGGAEPAPGGLR